jgi:acid phosphatase
MKSFFSAVVLAGLFTLSFARADGVKPVPQFNRLVWVWLENVSYQKMSNEPYVRSLIKGYPNARLMHYSRVSEVVQANDFALIAGSDLGVQDNNLIRVFNPTILDLLEAKNIPWKVYVETYPGSCYLSAGIGEYQRYRVPFLSVSKVQSDRFQCMKVLNYANLAEDVRNGTVAEFSVMIPNLSNSGSTGNTQLADASLKKLLSPILSNPDWAATTTFIISSTFNQAADADQGFTMIFGQGVADGAYSISTPYNHYNLLKTIEEGFSLGDLGQQDAKSSSVVGFWK